jgi:two-component sensor histidine kinase
MTANRSSEKFLETENLALRELLTQAGVDAARLLAQAGIDATQNEAAKQLQRLLLEELHHRVKNTLATVIAITSQSLRNAETLEQGRSAVENRLLALGRAHDLLLQGNWTTTQLDDVIHAAIEPFENPQAPKFSVQQIALGIDAGAVLPITMSLNELCTNAVKYGALSVPSGKIAITVSIDREKQRFTLVWTETGGPTVQQPKRRSFGTRLIDRLASQLHGEARLRYEPDGVRYELDVPLAGLQTSVSG